MSVKSVGRYSIGYAMLWTYSWVIHSLWYRRINIYGKENLPKGQPTILTPNHRNALMDALAVLFAMTNQTVFLARADIFRKRPIANLMYFLKIMPVYRPRDGRAEMVARSDESFHNAVEVMKMGRPLVMFPEGDHGEFKRLRPLKKGVSRIAFQAEEDHDFKLNLKIVPVGIDYEHFRFRAALTVSFGEPIDVDKYADLYREEPNKAIHALQNEIKEGMRKVMIHVGDEEHYNQILNLIKLYPRRLRKKKSLTNVKDDQRIVELLEYEKAQNPERWSQIIGHLEEIRDKCQSLGIQATSIPARLNRHILPLYHILLSLLGLPFGVYGAINNAIGFLVVTRLRKLFKDPQFDATAKFAGGLFILPFIYLAQIIVFQVFVHHWLYTLLYAISLPLGLLFAFHYFSFLGKQGLMSLKMIFSNLYFKGLREINTHKNRLFKILGEIESKS